MLVFLGGLQIPKLGDIDQDIAIFGYEALAFVKTTSNLFWHDHNLSKHLPVEFSTFLQWEGVSRN